MYQIKPWQELTFTDDFMFKRVMEAEDICAEALNAFLSWTIQRIVYFEDEKSLKAAYESKGVRLDVYLRDERERIYDVEMQVRKLREKQEVDAMTTLAKRARFYLGQIDADRLKVGAHYADLRPTIILFFCPFPIFDGSLSVYPFQYTCLKKPLLRLPDESEILFISSKGPREGLSETACALLDYMDGIVRDHPLVQRIEKRIRDVKQSGSEEERYMKFEMRILEERREAREEGKEEGRAEGKAEGRAEGKAEAARSLMEMLHCTKEKAMELLKIPPELQPKILALL